MSCIETKISSDVWYVLNRQLTSLRATNALVWEKHYALVIEAFYERKAVHGVLA